jgi:hypothetical protein
VDLAVLEDDEGDDDGKTPPPASGFPRYQYTLQKRFDKVYEKGVKNLKVTNLFFIQSRFVHPLGRERITGKRIYCYILCTTSC